MYVDANLYDHIEKGDWMPAAHRVPAEHCAAFRDARLSGRLSAYLSLTDVEELLGDWDRPERRPAAMGGELDIIARFPDGTVRITQFQELDTASQQR